MQLYPFLEVRIDVAIATEMDIGRELEETETSVNPARGQVK